MVEEHAEARILPQRSQQRIALVPRQAWESGIGRGSQPDQRVVRFSQLCVRRADVVRHMMIAIIVRQKRAQQASRAPLITRGGKNSGKSRTRPSDCGH